MTAAEGRERRVGEVDEAEGFESEAEGFRRRRRGDTLDAPKPLFFIGRVRNMGGVKIAIIDVTIVVNS